MCGKYFRILLLVKSPPGSPPRVWEVLTLLNIYWKPCRITPTCVGSTSYSPFTFSHRGDHPHVCGKYLLPFLYHFQSQGSPPRVWEVRGINKVKVVKKGITPTCVGSTLKRRQPLLLLEDHPHVCGKYLIDVYGMCICMGSPPRVWEVLLNFFEKVFLTGITPTCVGSTMIHFIKVSRI